MEALNCLAWILKQLEGVQCSVEKMSSSPIKTLQMSKQIWGQIDGKCIFRWDIYWKIGSWVSYQLSRRDIEMFGEYSFVFLFLFLWWFSGKLRAILIYFNEMFPNLKVYIYYSVCTHYVIKIINAIREYFSSPLRRDGSLGRAAS